MDPFNLDCFCLNCNSSSLYLECIASVTKWLCLSENSNKYLHFEVFTSSHMSELVVVEERSMLKLTCELFNKTSCFLLRSVSLSSLFSLLKSGLCPYFYVCSHQVQLVLFWTRHSNSSCQLNVSCASVHSAVQGSRSGWIRSHHGFSFSHNSRSQGGDEDGG